MIDEIEPTLTITPPPAGAICRAAAVLASQTPYTLTSNTCRNSSSGTSRAGRWKQIPALLTRMHPAELPGRLGDHPLDVRARRDVRRGRDRPAPGQREPAEHAAQGR